MKEYKTNDELIEILTSKGVIINDRDFAIKNISKYSYYSIINTYKSLFKINSDYKKGTKFEEILAIYKFDKSLKVIFLKYILEIEAIIKSYIANTIGENYSIDNYLNVNIFDDKGNDKIKLAIQNIISAINNEIIKNIGKHEAITHYKNKYDFVPPWVLTKILSLGTTSKFYGLMKQTDKQKISKVFGLSDNILKMILGNLTTIRNICAHDDRLFDYRSTFYININKVSGYSEKRKHPTTTLFIIILAIKKLLDDDTYTNFIDEINSEFNELESILTTISVKDIKSIMGFYSGFER
ncbi:MAG: Abi family protein [Bacilli bacterium]